MVGDVHGAVGDDEVRGSKGCLVRVEDTVGH